MHGVAQPGAAGRGDTHGARGSDGHHQGPPSRPCMNGLACGYRPHMETTEFKHVLDRPGPFASVLIDVSLDAAEGEEQLTIAAKDVANTLQADGAPAHTRSEERRVGKECSSRVGECQRERERKREE